MPEYPNSPESQLEARRCHLTQELASAALRLTAAQAQYDAINSDLIQVNERLNDVEV